MIWGENPPFLETSPFFRGVIYIYRLEDVFPIEMILFLGDMLVFCITPFITIVGAHLAGTGTDFSGSMGEKRDE